MGEKLNNPDPGRHRDYPAAARFLADTYGSMKKEKDYIDRILSGEKLYDGDMALEELIRTPASAETDTGVRVQTSGNSNPTERIGVLLAGGFVEKRNRELLRDVLEDVEGRRYLAWKLDVIETAMRERMDAMERAVFLRLFIKRMTYRQIREAYHKRTLHNRDISTMKKSALDMIGREIRLRDGAFEEGSIMTDKLLQEVRENEEYGNGG